MRQSGEKSKIAAEKIENRGVTPNMSDMTLFFRGQNKNTEPTADILSLRLGGWISNGDRVEGFYCIVTHKKK